MNKRNKISKLNIKMAWIDYKSLAFHRWEGRTHKIKNKNEILKRMEKNRKKTLTNTQTFFKLTSN